MLYEIMNYLNNFFLVEGAVRSGTYEIKNGEIILPFLQNGQYFLVKGSVFNDGVHQYGYDALKDEVFHGDIAPMAIPIEFLTLYSEIIEWQKKNAEIVSGPYKSESYGGYSYTKATNSKDGAYSWKDAFGSRLRTWRKI